MSTKQAYEDGLYNGRICRYIDNQEGDELEEASNDDWAESVPDSYTTEEEKQEYIRGCNNGYNDERTR